MFNKQITVPIVGTKTRVIIITGPCGAGKTTIAKLLVDKYQLILINGDIVKNKLFPNINNIERYPRKLKQVKHEIFTQTKRYFNKNQSVVIDYVILGKNYINQYKEAFGDNLQFKVLFPKKEIILNRDKSRKCWTAGMQCVNHLYEEFNELKSIIGAENYIDNSNETPSQTLKNHFASIV